MYFFQAPNLQNVLVISFLIGGSAAQISTRDPGIQEAINFERHNHANYPLDDFYTVPSTFNKHTKPGQLLKVEEHTDLTNYTVPSSLTMSRIMYASTSLNGTTVPVTGFILWPYAPWQATSNTSTSAKARQTTAKKPFPMIAWSHGTSGLFPECAPSNYRSLQYQFMTTYTLAMEGFTVVASDYAGLGATTQGSEESLEYLAGPAGANDVAYAVIAARKAFPHRLEGGSFVEMGHSEGGNVAIAFAERQARDPVPGYLGTVAMSAPTDLLALSTEADHLMSTLPQSQWPIWLFSISSVEVLLMAGINTVFPAYNYSGWTDATYTYWNNVIKPLQACLPTYSYGLPIVAETASLLKHDWKDNTYVQQWNQLAVVGNNTVKGPLLVTVGTNDALSVDFVVAAVEKSCELSPGEHIELDVYENMQHFPVIQASHMRRMQWIKDRFNGVPLNSGRCGKQTNYSGFNANYTLQSYTPNWLVDRVPGNETWKLSL